MQKIFINTNLGSREELEHHHKGIKDNEKSFIIRLKKIKGTDEELKKIMRWRMSPSVTKYLYTDPVLNLEGQRKWFETIKNDKTCIYWIISADENDIGVLALIDLNFDFKRTSWLWYIGEENYRGKGIAKKIQLNLYDYVFNTLKLNRLYSEILIFNEHEIENVHKKCGYEVEGILKEHVYKNGEFYDVVIMGITSNRWRSIKSFFDYPVIEFEE